MRKWITANMDGRTPSSEAPPPPRARPGAAVEPKVWRLFRLPAAFTDRDAARREAFLDTVPGVMFEEQGKG